MPTVRIPLVGSLTSRDATNTKLYGSSQKDQYFENCAFQVVRNPVTGKTSVWVSGRNDFDVTAVPSGASGNGTAIRFWRGHSTPGESHILTAFGSTNSTLYDGNTSLGTTTGQIIFINETSISGTATALFVSNGNKAYYFTEGGSLTEITDADFPSNQVPTLRITGNFAVMDGFHFIMATNGQIWHSDVNSIANWTSTAAISAQEYPDPGMGVIRYKNFIYALSRNSGEFFINAGNAAGATLDRVQNMAHKIGCISERAIIDFEDTVVWVGGGSSPGVYWLNDGRPEKISSSEIDYFLEGVSKNSVRLNAVTTYGVSGIALSINDTGTGNQQQYIFDPRIRLWSLWSFTDTLTQSDCPGTAPAGCYYVGPDEVTYLKSSTNIKAGAIVTGLIDFDTAKWKVLNAIRLIGDKTSSTMNVAVSWSDDGYANFSTPRNVNMASANPKLDRCGVFRRRAFKLTGIGEGASDRLARLEAIELDVEVCTA